MTSRTYYKRHDQVIYENPSPGNKKGGITTLEDKSLGCTMKAGNSKVKDVLKHTERLKNTGAKPYQRTGQRPCGDNYLGHVRLPDGIVYHRARNAIWRVCSDC